MIFTAIEPKELILAAALASKQEDRDAIDLAVIQGLKEKSVLDSYEQQKFIPFDPVSKRTEATIKVAEDRIFQVTKGAPQVILALSEMDNDTRQKIEQAVNDFAGKGYRTLGVARSDDGMRLSFLGLLPMFDPPREDAADTITRQKSTAWK